MRRSKPEHDLSHYYSFPHIWTADRAGVVCFTSNCADCIAWLAQTP
jgi:hypothetical protein